MTQRAQYSDTIAGFLRGDENAILGAIVGNAPNADLQQMQIRAWQAQTPILKTALASYSGRGKVYFEFSIPRLGRRIDALVLIDHVIFVVEFKVGDKKFTRAARRQVCDYALDLKNFHETSHAPMIAPVLVATAAKARDIAVVETQHRDNLLEPINANPKTLADAVQKVLAHKKDKPIAPEQWEGGGYHPTPTIIEAAAALYRGHSVEEISRSDADEMNLSQTSQAVAKVIKEARAKSHKAICFVTGVPGAGKTLVGLNINSQHNESKGDMRSVFLSGNNPLVNVLREALARDSIRQNEERNLPRLTKKAALSSVESFIQNVHHFRDDCLKTEKPPHEKVALFDEAQRAWNRAQTAAFMHRKKKLADFDMSEPEFLISCLDRHSDWAAIVCLVGGGQEIKSGEAGIGGWVDALVNQYPHWHPYISPRLEDAEYGAKEVLAKLRRGVNPPVMMDELHLATSMRSFRAERVSDLVKSVLDMDAASAKQTLCRISKRRNSKYPIVLTRDLRTAKKWLRSQARGSERYGLIVSSHAERLRPYAIDVRPRINPVHWFLHDEDDTRSSYYLEDVVTEFEVQGLEVDWACVTWDADMRYKPGEWQHRRFRGARWQHIRKDDDQTYQKNAYRVLLTRARQGMVIVVPEGDDNDPTRAREYYDPTFNYLKEIGFEVID